MHNPRVGEAPITVFATIRCQDNGDYLYKMADRQGTTPLPTDDKLAHRRAPVRRTAPPRGWGATRTYMYRYLFGVRDLAEIGWHTVNFGEGIRMLCQPCR